MALAAGIQRKLVDVLAQVGVPITPMELAPRIQKDYEATKKLLRRMAEDGIIARPEPGKYAVKIGAANVPDVPQNGIPD
jgi:hypothetical protein